MKLTKRQKLISSCSHPLSGGFSTRSEVKEAKQLVKGHYWIDRDQQEYYAVSPTGRHTIIPYVWYSWASIKIKKEWLVLARKCARLWAKGKYKESNKLYNQMLDM